MKLNEEQLDKIREFVTANPRCDICGIESGLEVFILDRMTEEQFDAQCVGKILRKVDGAYFPL